MSAGIYIHIPFCKSRCSYCDFATDIYRDRETVKRYVKALISEIESTDYSGHRIDTVYFGGGTPSLLDPEHIRSILSAVNSRFQIASEAELTLEMNPATVTLSDLRELRDLGINRASFGVQTFDDKLLRMLARDHDADDARNTYDLLRKAGFQNVSFDLIAGLPDQTLEDWSRNLEQAMLMGPEHLSLYILEIHEGTPLAGQIASKRRSVPDDDLAGEMYELMQDKLQSAGYRQYEISNFARPGFESRHNNKYWKMETVYGFGVSAHSFDGISRRWSNERNTGAYVSAIEEGKPARVTDDTLDESQLAAECAFLALRLREGLNVLDFSRRFGGDVFAKYEPELKNLIDAGLLEHRGETFYLTKRGMLFSNEVFEVFV